MSKVYHTSDIHLSFKADGSVHKDMAQRSWSKGSPNYVGYLEKLSDFGKNNIKSNDFCIVTGDLTHDMKHRDAVHSFRWMRANFNGIIVACRGNHDRDIDFKKLRLDSVGSNFYLLDEGEIISIGAYTFGCYSDHKDKTNATNYTEYLKMAEAIVKQAKIKETIPVMISHYPLPLEIAKKVKGLTAYLSGHVHCTKGDYPDGNNWEWYDAAAKPTDNKTINDCYYSTGTTDVLLVLEKEIFKEITCLEVAPVSINNSNKSKIGQAFECAPKFIDKFEVEDSFNPGNIISGFMCRKKGLMYGSLYITHVNNAEIDPQLIYGTPKLAYPYKPNSTTEYAEFPNCSHFYIADKWNGTNILFYKYYDSLGNLFITAKTKGTAIVKDGDFGQFFSLTREALGWNDPGSIMLNLPNILMPLMKDSIQSYSFELCGKKEPHLVNYDFDIDLKPLFLGREDGRIEPVITSECNYYNSASNDEIVEACKNNQWMDFEINEQYRKLHNLPVKYEYNHFQTEGKVLYLMDYHDLCVSRTLYKIKPKDIEEMHWQTFDVDTVNKVSEAVKKIKRDGMNVTEQTLQEELDMGPKEWNKFGKQVLASVNVDRPDDKREVLILVGVPGSGKSTFAKELEKTGWIRVNQDDLGSRNKCKTLMSEALANNKKVIVDRCNFDVNQRKAWLDLAKKHGVSKVQAIVFNTPTELCKDRIMTRLDHPTVTPIEGSKKLVDVFTSMLVPIRDDEGFVGVVGVSTVEEVDTLIKKFND